MVTESFNYTVSDGSGGTDIAVITITIMGVNDTPVADDETNSVNVSSTLTVTDGTSDVLHGDTDADASASLTVTGIRTGQEGGSGTAGTVGTSLTGSYGTMLSSTQSIGMNFKLFHQKLADGSLATANETGKPYSTDFAFDIGYLKKFGSRNQHQFGQRGESKRCG